MSAHKEFTPGQQVWQAWLRFSADTDKFIPPVERTLLSIEPHRPDEMMTTVRLRRLEGGEITVFLTVRFQPGAYLTFGLFHTEAEAMAAILANLELRRTQVERRNKKLMRRLQRGVEDYKTACANRNMAKVHQAARAAPEFFEPKGGPRAQVP